jgi:putative serine protease PepD
MQDGATPQTGPPLAPSQSPLAAERRRGGRVVAAALLVGALAGAATGVGGAAVLHDNSTATTLAGASTPAPLTVASGSSSRVRSGSTESAAATVLPSVVKIYASSPTASGSGSGIILTRSGQILTNNHVVELALNGGRLAVSFNDGTTARATIVGRDPLTDLAVIQAKTNKSLTPATLGNSGSLRVGEPVVAVGSPFGLDSTVTTGIVSALNRPVITQGDVPGDPTTVFPAIQTDAAINPGNSGGPLVDSNGQVVGINSAIKTDSSTAGVQGGSIGLGFAIPINDAIPIVEQLQHGQTPTHARIGVSVRDATNQFGLPDGALVGAVDPNTPAEQAGLQKGDVITRVDGHLISNADSLVATVRSYRPGDEVTLTVTSSTHHGKSTGPSHTVRLTLGSD